MYTLDEAACRNVCGGVALACHLPVLTLIPGARAACLDWLGAVDRMLLRVLPAALLGREGESGGAWLRAARMARAAA